MRIYGQWGSIHGQWGVLIFWLFCLRSTSEWGCQDLVLRLVSRWPVDQLHNARRILFVSPRLIHCFASRVHLRRSAFVFGQHFLSPGFDTIVALRASSLMCTLASIAP